MNYQTQEFSIDLPELVMDRSVNVLTLTEPETGTPFQLIVNRDVLLANETLHECVDRQIGLMTRQAKSFKVASREDGVLGETGVPSVIIESSFSKAGKSFFQIQALFALEPPKLMALTLSSPAPLQEGHRAAWKEILSSMRPRSPETGETTPPALAQA